MFHLNLCLEKNLGHGHSSLCFYRGLLITIPEVMPKWAKAVSMTQALQLTQTPSNSQMSSQWHPSCWNSKEFIIPSDSQCWFQLWKPTKLHTKIFWKCTQNLYVQSCSRLFFQPKCIQMSPALRPPRASVEPFWAIKVHGWPSAKATRLHQHLWIFAVSFTGIPAASFFDEVLRCKPGIPNEKKMGLFMGIVMDSVYIYIFIMGMMRI